MTNLKHTPGPWLLFPDGDFQSRPQLCETWEQVEQQQRHAHDVTDGSVDYFVVSVPQVQALPDLLVALETICDGDRRIGTNMPSEWIDAGRAAIAKARGEQGEQ